MLVGTDANQQADAPDGQGGEQPDITGVSASLGHKNMTDEDSVVTICGPEWH